MGCLLCQESLVGLRLGRSGEFAEQKEIGIVWSTPIGVERKIMNQQTATGGQVDPRASKVCGS